MPPAKQNGAQQLASHSKLASHAKADDPASQSPTSGPHGPSSTEEHAEAPYPSGSDAKHVSHIKSDLRGPIAEEGHVKTPSSRMSQSLMDAPVQHAPAESRPEHDYHSKPESEEFPQDVQPHRVTETGTSPPEATNVDGYKNASLVDPVPNGWFSKRSFVAVICLVVAQFATTIEVVFDYFSARWHVEVPGSETRSHLLMMAAVQIVGCVLMDFICFVDRRRLQIVAFYIAGTLLFLAGVSYFVEALRCIYVDTFCVVVAYAWIGMVRFAFIRGIYDGAAKSYRSLWVAILVATIFFTEFTSSIFLYMSVNTDFPLMQVMFFIQGAALIGLASYLVMFREHCNPVYGTADSSARGKELVRHLYKMSNVWKTMRRSSPVSRDFSETLASVDKRAANAFRAIKLIAASCIAWICMYLIKFPEHITQLHNAHMRQCFFAKYDIVLPFFVAVPLLAFLQWYEKSLRTPHVYFAILAIGLIAGLSQGPIAAMVHPQIPRFNNCATHHVVMSNFAFEDVTLDGKGVILGVNQTWRGCWHDQHVCVRGHLVTSRNCSSQNVNHLATIESEKDIELSNGSFVLLHGSKGSKAHRVVVDIKNFTLEQKPGMTLFIEFNLDETDHHITCEAAEKAFFHTKLMEKPVRKETHYSTAGGHYAVVRLLTHRKVRKTGSPEKPQRNTKRNLREEKLVELVAPFRVPLGYLIGPLLLASASKVLLYWVYFNVNFLAPQELGRCSLGIGYFCAALGVVGGSHVISSPASAVVTCVWALGISILSALGVLVYTYLVPSYDVREYQRLDAFE